MADPPDRGVRMIPPVEAEASVGTYDEDWHRIAQWEHDALRLLVRYVRGGRFADGAALTVVMVVNPLLLLVGRRWPRRTCECCGWRGVEFLWAHHGRWVVRDSICPHCESRPRHRALTLLVPSVVPADAVRNALHFAPEPLLAAALRARYPGAEYRTTDLYRTDVDLPGEDVQALTIADASADLVICNHVLEHVTDDERAIAELARVTAPGGVAFVTVPGDWTGSPTVTFDRPDENGHLRHYGADVATLLRRSFAEVRSVGAESISPDPRRNGIRTDEPVFVCRP